MHWVIFSERQVCVCVCVILFGKANSFDNVLRKSCFLKHVIEGTTEKKIEGTERRGRWSKQLRDDLKENGTYRNLKEEALDHTVWRTRIKNTSSEDIGEKKIEKNLLLSGFIICAV